MLQGGLPTETQRSKFLALWESAGSGAALGNLAESSLPFAGQSLAAFFGNWFRTGLKEGSYTAAWFVQQ